MKISVIIPTIRSGGIFEFELPALANQTMPKEDYEVILVDDYPTNRETEATQFAEETGLKLKWMRGKKPYWRSNQNIANARNTALCFAEGELVVFIDDYSWVNSEYLETVWTIYNEKKQYSLIGPVSSIEYSEPPYPKDLSTLKIRAEDRRLLNVPTAFGIQGKVKEKVHLEHRRNSFCSGSWFYTSNASAPLEKIIEVNGFWEIADLTREEDILLGLALERFGWKFRFLKSPESTVYHMNHGWPELQDKPKYQEVTYKELGWEAAEIKGKMVEGAGGRGICGLNTKPNQVQLVTKDVFNTQYPGSWALLEHFKKTNDLKFNREIGFDLNWETMTRADL